MVSNASTILKSKEKFLIKLGLERISQILELLGNPQDKYQIIHIAGTNGKGSTSKIINEILVQSNYKTGLYTSPHLFNYTERIKVDNDDISEYLFNKLIDEINNLAIKNNINLTEFELLTAVGFYYFYIKKVDYAIIETGLGGLYDATNVVKNSLSVITTIDFDHTERLGDTIEKIAKQKAGIIKPNSKVIISKDNLGYKTIENTAKQKNAKIIDAQPIIVEFDGKNNYAYINNEKTDFNLLGSYQAQNLSLAICAINNLNIKTDFNIIKKALKHVTWRFRCEFHKKNNILIDSAHNPQGIKVLRNFLDENFNTSNKTFIFGCLKNKDYASMLDILVRENDELYFIEYNHPNSLKFDELDKKYNAKKIDNINEIIKKDKLKVFCGSIYMLGEIFNNLHL